MAVALEHRGRTRIVSNRRMDSLVRFACAVGRDRTTEPRLDAVLDQLERDNDEGRWAWDGFDVQRVFSAEDRPFFAAVFAEVAQRVSRRRLGNPAAQGWQESLGRDDRHDVLGQLG